MRHQYDFMTVQNIQNFLFFLVRDLRNVNQKIYFYCQTY